MTITQLAPYMIQRLNGHYYLFPTSEPGDIIATRPATCAGHAEILADLDFHLQHLSAMEPCS